MSVIITSVRATQATQLSVGSLGGSPSDVCSFSFITIFSGKWPRGARNRSRNFPTYQKAFGYLNKLHSGGWISDEVYCQAWETLLACPVLTYDDPVYGVPMHEPFPDKHGSVRGIPAARAAEGDSFEETISRLSELFVVGDDSAEHVIMEGSEESDHWLDFPYQPFNDAFYQSRS